MRTGSKDLFSPRWLHRILSSLPDTKRYLVAYSGGPDSHALLHSLAALRPNLSGISVCAIHVNHGLAATAADWEGHCAEVCQGLQITFHAVRVTVGRTRGTSIEEEARRVRYQALARYMDQGDVVLTAHTEDDQAETLLLQLLRGSGADGLAAMPGHVAFACGWLARPLLTLPRRALQVYSRTQALDSVEDPSNQDRRLARNYVRHEVLPVLESRWPSVGQVLARTALHLAQSRQLMIDLAEIDLAHVRNPDTNTLNRCGLMPLDSSRRRNAIRAWIRDSGATLPSTSQLDQIEKNVLESAIDASPVVSFGDTSVRRYANDLYLLPRRLTTSQAAFCWELPTTRSLVGGQLTAKFSKGQGIASVWVPHNKVWVQFRHGGERFRMTGSGHHKSLKKLFQEWRIPPWERSLIPLIYIEDHLAAVAGLWVSQRFASRSHEMGWMIEWRRDQIHCQNGFRNLT